MSTGLLFDCDEAVAKFIFEKYGWAPFKYDAAIGLLVNGQLHGATFFQGYNGFNLELSYYGSKTMTAGVVRSLARFGLVTFNPSRVTLVTSKRNKRYIRSLQRMGFKLEGTQRCYYGHRDCNRNTAVRFVMFRPGVEALAKFSHPLKKAS